MIENNTVTNFEEDDEIDLAELFFVLRRKIWIIVSCGLTGAIIGRGAALQLIMEVNTMAFTKSDRADAPVRRKGGMHRRKFAFSVARIM